MGATGVDGGVATVVAAPHAATETQAVATARRRDTILNIGMTLIHVVGSIRVDRTPRSRLVTETRRNSRDAAEMRCANRGYAPVTPRVH